MAPEHRLNHDGHERLRASLARAVRAGILTPEQAEAVVELEVAGAPATAAAAAAVAAADGPGPAEGRRIPLVIEVLGYLGAVLVLAGAGILAAEFWDELTTTDRLIGLGVATAALTAAGLAIRDETEPVLRRLRGILLLLASAGLLGFSALFGRRALDLDGEATTVLVGVAGTIHAAALWRLRERPAQHLACFAGAVVGVAGATLWAGGEAAALGVTLWLTGVVWAGVSLAGVLPPPATGRLLGSVLVLVAPGITAIQHEGPGFVLALATAVALVVTGVSAGVFVLTAAGVVGLLVYLPFSINWFVGDAIGAPAALLLSGLLLLGGVVPVLVRRGGPSRGR